MRVKETYLIFYSIRLTEILSEMKGKDFSVRTPKVFKVENDKFFFEMKRYHGILVLGPSEFWNRKILN